MNQIQDILKCAMCKDTFTSAPITLICCKSTICKHHLQEQLKKNEGQKTFKCIICEVSHTIKDNNKIYIANKIVEEILGTKILQEIETIKRANFGDIFSLTNTEIKKLESSFHKINDLINDPKNYIYGIISKLKGDIDLRIKEQNR